MRICSLLPSATEIVYALGLGDQLVAVTHACDFPAAARAKPVVTRSVIDQANLDSAGIDAAVARDLADGGSLYELDRELLTELRPDVILTQALCDVCAVSFDAVRTFAAELPNRPQVVSLDPNSLEAVLRTVQTVATAAGRTERAGAVISALRTRIDAVRREGSRRVTKPRVLLMEWADPPMCCGHWTPELIALAGGVDPFNRSGRPAVKIGWNDLVTSNPDIVAVAPCGYDLERAAVDANRILARPELAQVTAIRTGAVYAIDGNQYFNRPGPRLVDSLEILSEIIAPGSFEGRVAADGFVRMTPTGAIAVS